MRTFKKPHKYGAKKTTYNGYTYDSKLEAGVAERLDWRLKAGEFKEWERQYGVDLYENCPHCGEWIRKARWKVDFRIHHHNGTFELHEAKGVRTSDFIKKEKMLKRMIERNHPDMKDHFYTITYK